jgi:tetratricopeptide (TPR) repeat protein/predicted Ser/Thr protein kinase/predicted secreted protein
MKCPKCHHENPPETTYCGKCATPLRPNVTETMAPPQEDLATGTTFAGRYQVIEELGHGGMGKVYKVHDTKVGEKIALKLIRPEAGLDSRTVERFSNELKLARKVRHKNVCQMFDLGEDKGTRYITMEYVHGEDLRQLLRKVVRMSPGQAVAVARQVCAGLEEAHKLGVVHRDLKPQNIMLDEDGQTRIMDFGIARSLMGKSITGAGTFIGTPEYMSPEQVEGKDVDERSDIYSLGVILYEMVTGRRPFDGETALAIAHKHKYETPEDPRTVDPQIPERLAQVILRCLEKDKAARYESAGALGADLAAIEAGLPTTEKVVAKRKPFTSKEITVKFNLRKALVPAILVLAAVVAAAYFLAIRKPGPALNPKLALVSSFANRTGDANLDALGQIAAYQIVQSLSQTGLLEVGLPMSAQESARIIDAESGAPRDQDEMRALVKRTGAGTLVSGAFFIINGKLQFHAIITDLARRKPIRTLEPLSGNPGQQMDLIAELSQRVMGAIALHFSGTSTSGYAHRLRRLPVFEAYQEFFKGLDTFGVDYQQTIRHFTRAVELDPTFATAKLYIAVAYGNQRFYEKACDYLESIEKTREELSLVETHLLDWAKSLYGGQNETALRYIREAKRLAPDSIEISHILGGAALVLNRPREAVEAYALLASLDPKTIFVRPASGWCLKALASAHHMLGEYKKELKVAKQAEKYFPKNLQFPAIEVRSLAALGKTGEVRKVVEGSLDVDETSGAPGNVMMEAAQELYAHGHKDASLEFAAMAIEWAGGRPEAERKTEGRQGFYADALYFAGRLDEAGKIYASLAAEHPEDIDYQGCLGTLAARRGDRDEALRISGELAAIDRRFLFGSHTYWRACIATLLGEKEQAVALLKEAFSQGQGYGVSLHRDINLEPLWDYPPFKELLRPKG